MSRNAPRAGDPPGALPLTIRHATQGLLYAVSGALLAASVFVFLRDPPASLAAMDLIRLVDQNGDAQISAAEYERVGDGELPMSYVDADGDGSLAPWEVDAIIRYVSPLRASMSWVPRAL